MARSKHTGARVRLLRTIETRSGRKFRRGVIMRCVGGDRSGLSLVCWVRGYRHDIRGVESWNVEIIEAAPKEDERGHHDHY